MSFLPSRGPKKLTFAFFWALTHFRVFFIPVFHFRVCHKIHRDTLGWESWLSRSSHTRVLPSPVRAPPLPVPVAAAVSLRAAGPPAAEVQFWVDSHFRGPVSQRFKQNWFCFLAYTSENIPQNERIVFDGCRRCENRCSSHSSRKQ